MADKTARLIGRPSKFTHAFALKMCERIAKGESLREICAGKGTPTLSTVHKWLNEIPEFSEQYARAREAQAEFYADEIISIADNVLPDAVEVAKAKLRVDARKWKASKLAPKKYGDKIEVDSKSSDGSMTPRPALTAEAFAEIARQIIDEV